MWIRLLEVGEYRKKKATVLGMIEWMGASVWYDSQLEKFAKTPPFTKRVATILLDNLLGGEESDDESRPVTKRRRLALKR